MCCLIGQAFATLVNSPCSEVSDWLEILTARRSRLKDRHQEFVMPEFNKSINVRAAVSALVAHRYIIRSKAVFFIQCSQARNTSILHQSEIDVDVLAAYARR